MPIAWLAAPHPSASAANFNFPLTNYQIHTFSTTQPAINTQKMTDEPTQTCPICQTPGHPNPRYPNHLCFTCANKAVDQNGRALVFYNASFGGGFRACYRDDGSDCLDVTQSHVCFVQGRRVWADEARFGGIVVMVYG